MTAAVDDPGSRLDATGRRLAYLPAALLGNGALLVTLSARGEVERMLWPNVDGPDNVRELRLGVRDGERIAWLDELPGTWSQAWDGDASVLRTTVAKGGLRAEVVDAVDPEEPVLVRRVETRPGALVVAVSPRLEGVDHAAGAFVDPGSGFVVLHRRRAALAIGVDTAGAAADVGSADGHGDDVAHVSPLWGRVVAPHDGVVHVVVAFGTTPFAALGLAREHLAAPGELTGRRRAADARVVARTSLEPTDDPDLDRILRRSVLVLEQLTDRATGGIVAAPELDEGFAECGGYGFVWPRDLAYVVLGLLAAGRGDAAAGALRWLARTQAPEGLWLHRYWVTGEPAPSWGLHQVDETGVALVAAEASAELEDEGLDRELWPVVRRAAALLASFVDPVTALPRASTDLWEQRDGQHAYSAAAVVAGLRAASFAAERHEPSLARSYRDAARRVARAIDEQLWGPELGRYRRGVSMARRDGLGRPPGPAYERRVPYPNRRVSTVDEVDARLDSSLLGLAWPFAPLGVGSERVRATVAAVEQGLAAPGGGLLRHEGDTYAGGHEWPLATLWLGLALRALGDTEGHRRALVHAAGRATALDLLPEQVLPDGRPAWVLPLGWSHAMLLLAARPELALVRRLREERESGDGRGG